MAGLFYNLGRKVGPKVRKGKWVWQSLTGTDADVLAAEYEVGNDLVGEVLKQVELDKDERVWQLLDTVSAKLAKCVVNKQRRFKFYVTTDPGANAFALPGGFIFVTRGLIELCDYDPGELAFVLGHEMAHVIKGHAIGRILSNTAISTVSRTAAMRTPLGGWFKKVGIKFLESAYSQSNEFEADALGAKFLKAGAYDTASAEKLLARLGELSKNQDQGIEALGVYFSTHPPISDRIAGVRDVLGTK